MLAPILATWLATSPLLVSADEAARVAIPALEMPRSGKWVAESEYQEFAPPRETWERSLAHIRSTARARVAVEEWEKDWIRERAYITEPTWVPAVAQRWKQTPTSVVRSESLARSGELTRTTSRERLRSTGEWSATTTRIATSSELVWWLGEVGQPRRVQREKLRLDRGRYGGALFVVAGFLDSASASLRAARTSASAVESDTSVSWSLDLSRPLGLAVLNEYDLPGGLSEIPGGRLHGEFARVPSGATLALEWSDPTDSRVARQFGRWNEKDELVFFEAETFAPGTGFTTTRSSVRLAQTRAEVDASECVWRAHAGDYVVDLRFGQVLTYRVGVEGLPTDESLRARGERDAARRAATAPVVQATVECSGGSLHGSGALGAAQLDLRARDVGEVIPIEFELVNRGVTAIELGAVSADCGCIAPEIEARFIPAGGSVLLRLRQSIDREGPRSSNVRIPVVSGGSGEIRIGIAFIGAAGTKARDRGVER